MEGRGFAGGAQFVDDFDIGDIFDSFFGGACCMMCAVPYGRVCDGRRPRIDIITHTLYKPTRHTYTPTQARAGRGGHGAARGGGGRRRWCRGTTCVWT